jgi:arylsulfatase A-like enzyme/dienelactone hydrolase
MRVPRSISRRGLRDSATALLAVLALLGPSPGAAAPAARRPNILFIFSDDHGAQSISAYGSYRNRTPHLDRIAREGMRFANCFCTNSICAPSRATILTGKHTHLTGHTTNERIFDDRLPTFPRLLRDSGYQTALIGKWHLNSEPVGFDHWDVLINQGIYYNPPMVRNGRYVEHTGYVTDIITDLTIDWLEKHRDPGRPFLLMSQHKAPHRGWDPALRHLAMFDDTLLAEPPTLFDDWSNRSSAWSHSEMNIGDLTPGDLHLETPAWQLDAEQRVAWESVYEPKNRAFREAKLAGKALLKWKYQRFAKDYLRTVAAVDEGVGRILDHLEKSGLAESTLVIYSSDQGWFLGEHCMFDKRWMYEESYRMPLLVRWPGVVQPGKVDTHLVQNLDFAQTLLDVAGVATPSDMQGESLVPLMRGQAPKDWRRSLYYHYYEDKGAHKVPRHYGVRTERHKLIHYYRIGEWELFDLWKDPDELVSLYGKPGYERVTAALRAEADSLRRTYRVSEEADREYDVFHSSLEQRWSLLSRLGRLPSRWGVDVDTLGIEELRDHRRVRVAYRIGDEKVEAFLLVPRGNGLRPGVVAVHPGPESGSYARGKSLVAGVAGDPRMAYGLDLVRRGFVVMCPDRLGFESRRLGRSTSAEDRRRETTADRFVADGSSLLGQELVELWFAADYLAKRPGVHYNRVGVMGHGEGGLLATLLTYVDEEIRAGVSSDGTRAFMATGKPGDPMLAVPGILRWGGIEDAIAGIYPRPFLEVSSSKDREAHFAKPRRRYADLSFGERLRFDEVAGAAGPPTPAMRERAYEWLATWLK